MCCALSTINVCRSPTGKYMMSLTMIKPWLKCRLALTALLLIVCLSVCCNAAPLHSNSTLSRPSLYLPIRDPHTLTGRATIPDRMYEVVADSSRLFARSTSQDPSCPNGFLCVLEDCPVGLKCQPGDSCVNFEGTSACVTSSLQLCAINPTTFEAVGCNGGQCW